MTTRFSHFELEDFILDDYFLKLAKDVHLNKREHEWNMLLQDYPDKKELMENACLLIHSMLITETKVPDSVIQQNFELLEDKIHQKKRNKNVLIRLTAVAAVILLIITSTYFFNQNTPVSGNFNKEELFSLLERSETESDHIQIYTNDNHKKIEVDQDAVIIQEEDGSLTVNSEKRTDPEQVSSCYNCLIVPNGKRSQLTLADGSRIWINSGTKLVYPTNFDQKQREIFVDGEIYIEVAHNKSQPFYVNTKALNIKVLGTTFNVTAYSSENTSNVVLVSGSVDVTAGNHQTVRMSPNKCFKLENETSSLTDVDVTNYTCWKDGYLKISNISLSEIFTKLSRYYNIKFIYDESIGSIRYKGKLRLEGSVEDVLFNIAQTEPITFIKENNTLIIRKIKNPSSDNL